MSLRAAFVLMLTASVGATMARAQYSTGFESPTFFSGPISGQDLWSTAANPGTARVLTDSEIATELSNAGLNAGQTVHGGTQALLVSGAGASNATIRSIPGLETQPLVRLEIWARPLTAGTTGAPLGNIFLTMEDSTSTRAAAFRFGTAFGQTIDYGTNVGGVWQPTSILWDSDSWYHLIMDVDYVAKTYNLFINDTAVSQNPIPFYNSASTSFSQVRIFRGANQAGMIVDDFRLLPVPEPGTPIMAMAGAVGACLRRKRSRSC